MRTLANHTVEVSSPPLLAHYYRPQEGALEGLVSPCAFGESPGGMLLWEISKAELILHLPANEHSSIYTGTVLKTKQGK